MALKGKSLFLYGYEVTEFNKYLPFKPASDVVSLAELTEGYYSLTGLTQEIKRAMESVYEMGVFNVEADRTFNQNTENRVIIESLTSGYLELLFATGPSYENSCAELIGYGVSDLTGFTSYEGVSDTGAKVFTEQIGYNYLSSSQNFNQTAVVNVSTVGTKEAIVWSTQRFYQVDFKYEPESKVIVDWEPFLDWATRMRPFDFTPDYENHPESVGDVTLERTSADGKGLAFKWREMLPQFPFFYETGQLVMRVVPTDI
jgi:hypothetical protein